MCILHTLPAGIYSDLKPAECMLSRDGKVKADRFQVLRDFPAPSANATMIGTQATPQPEPYRGRAEAKSDLYAWAATMHHELSGRRSCGRSAIQLPQVARSRPM